MSERRSEFRKNEKAWTMPGEFEYDSMSGS